MGWAIAGIVVGVVLLVSAGIATTWSYQPAAIRRPIRRIGRWLNKNDRIVGDYPYEDEM